MPSVTITVIADAPTCAPNQARVYGIAKHEAAQIKCVVDANPPDVEFKWTFNNSAESIDVTASHVSRYGTTSIVSYKPMTELDYGTLLCSATNRIGKQKTPCFFHIIAAGEYLRTSAHPHTASYNSINVVWGVEKRVWN